MIDRDVFDSPDWRRRRQEVERLRHVSAQDLPAQLLQLIRENHRSLGVLNAALDLLGSLRADVIPGLLALLADADAEVRAYALIALAQQRAPESIQPVLRCLDDPDPNVRFNAVECLGRLQALEAIEPLLKILRARDFYLSFAALDALARIGTSTAADEISRLVGDELIGAAAVEALGYIGGISAVPVILDWLETPGGEAGPAVAALCALNRDRPGDPAGVHAVPYLVSEAIGRAGQEKLLAALAAETRKPAQAGRVSLLQDLVTAAGWLLGQPGGGKQPAARAEFIVGARRQLILLLGAPQLREQALDALKRSGKESIPALVEKLSDPDAEARRAVLAALGSIGDPSAVPALLAALQNEEGDLPAVAAGALGKIGDRAAFDALCAQLDHPSALVRQSVIGAINSLGHPGHTAKMVELAQHGSPPAREAAIRSLGYFGDARGLEVALQASQDALIGVRQAAIESLSMYEDPRVNTVLRRAAQDPLPAVRCAAARALRFSPPEPAVPALVQLTGDTEMWVRIYACRSLAYFRHPAALTALEARLDDALPPVRAAAVEALGRSGGAAIVPKLIALLQDPESDVVEKAAASLAATRLPAAVPALAALLNHPSPAVRRAALAALGEHGSAEAVQALRQARLPAEDTLLLMETLLRARSPQAVALIAEGLQSGEQRKAAAAALAALGEAALPEIERLALQPGCALEGRLAAVETLQLINSPKATNLLIALLNDPAERVRRNAAYALGELGSAAARPALLKLAQTAPDEPTRRSAQSALKKLR